MLGGCTKAGHTATVFYAHQPYGDCMPSTLSLDATLFTKAQLLERLEMPQLEQIALAGRSNVGKSSLINALAGRKQLAKTSATPGKTRSINYYTVQPENFWLVDLPGYGYARCSKEERVAWAKLIEQYLTQCTALKGLALLLDSRLSPQKIDQDLAAFARANHLNILPVLTKADQTKQMDIAKRQKEWAALLGVKPLVVAAKNGRGIEALWQALYACIGHSPT